MPTLCHCPMTPRRRRGYILFLFLRSCAQPATGFIHRTSIPIDHSQYLLPFRRLSSITPTCGIYLELGTPYKHFQIRSSHDHMLSLTAVEALTALSGIIPNKPRKKVHLQHGAVHQRKQVAEMYKYVHQIYGTAVYRPPGTKKA